LELTNTLKHHYDEVTAIKVSHDGTKVASGTSNKNIILWDATTKQIIHKKFSYHNSKIIDLDWSGDDSYLASCSMDKTVKIWNISETVLLKTFENMDSEVLQKLRFVNENELICGGYSIALRLFSFK
jgi:WD40 repeat protein